MNGGIWDEKDEIPKNGMHSYEVDANFSI